MLGSRASPMRSQLVAGMPTLNQVCLTAFLSWLQEEQDSRARSGPIPSATQFLGSCQWDGDRSQRRATSADSE